MKIENYRDWLDGRVYIDDIYYRTILGENINLNFDLSSEEYTVFKDTAHRLGLFPLLQRQDVEDLNPALVKMYVSSDNREEVVVPVDFGVPWVAGMEKELPPLSLIHLILWESRKGLDKRRAWEGPYRKITNDIINRFSHATLGWSLDTLRYDPYRFVAREVEERGIAPVLEALVGTTDKAALFNMVKTANENLTGQQKERSELFKIAKALKKSLIAIPLDGKPLPRPHNPT